MIYRSKKITIRKPGACFLKKTFRKTILFTFNILFFNFNNVSLNEKAKKFCAVNYVYFAADSFFDSELKHLNELVNESMQELSLFQFRKFKTLLDYQLQVYHKQAQKEQKFYLAL